jgi:hypothetical protein
MVSFAFFLALAYLVEEEGLHPLMALIIACIWLAVRHG